MWLDGRVVHCLVVVTQCHLVRSKDKMLNFKIKKKWRNLRGLLGWKSRFLGGGGVCGWMHIGVLFGGSHTMPLGSFKRSDFQF